MENSQRGLLTADGVTVPEISGIQCTLCTYLTGHARIRTLHDIEATHV